MQTAIACFYHEATPVSVNEILLQADYFKAHYKLVPSVVKMLNEILGYNQKDHGKSSITFKRFADRWGREYPHVIYALDCLGLLKVTRIAIRKRHDYHGKCYDYLVTPKAMAALRDCNKQYLYRVMFDPAERRKITKHTSKSGYKHRVYGDVRDDIKAVIDNMTFDVAEIDQACDAMPDGKAACVYCLLVHVIKKDYKALKYNMSDGRVWNLFTQLPAEIKRIIKVKSFTLQAVIDIRSCYPSLFAKYLCADITDPKVMAEKARYNNIFLVKERDPKTYLAQELQLPRNVIKEVLIKYYNGYPVSKNPKSAFYKLDCYFQAQFPLLYATWRKTDIKQTGNNIGKYWETKLMLDRSIWDKAKALGIVIGYEYDGMSLYAKDNSKCQELLDYIQQRSLELLGVKLVFVDKGAL